MFKNVAKVEFGFENCEVITLPFGSFGRFIISDMHRSLYRYASSRIQILEQADKIAIEIFKPDGQEYDPPAEGMTAIQRLTRYEDIVSIGLYYTDGSYDEFYADYDGEEINKNQKNHISSKGNLYIVIGKGLAIEDYFPEDDIEDPHMIEYRKATFRDDEFSWSQEDGAQTGFQDEGD